MGLTEQKTLTKIRNVGFIAHQIKVPGTVDGIAIHHGTLDAIVLYHQLAIHPTRGILEHQFLGIFITAKITGGKQIDAGHLQFGRGYRAFITANAMLRQVIGAHPGHFKQGRNQTIGHTTVLYAFTDRIDPWVKGLHGVTYHDAALTMNAGFFGQSKIGTNPHRHHHQVSVNFSAVLEAQFFNPVLADNGFRLRTHQEVHAPFFQRLLQHFRGRRIELSLH